jgi:hypothetical protein
MRYPVINLNEIDESGFCYYEYPDSKDKGAFIEISKNKQETKIKVDRFSTIMFYFTVHQNKLYGATRFDSLIKSLPSSFSRKINQIAVIEFVRTNTLIGDKTFIEHIYAIRPGCELIFDNNIAQYQINEWFKLPGEINYKYYDKKKAMNDLHESFIAAIKQIVKNNENIITYLTGGLDSRQIFGELSAQKGNQFEAVSYGNKNTIDYFAANKLCEHFKTNFIFLEWKNVKSFKEYYEIYSNNFDNMVSLFECHGFDVYLDSNLPYKSDSNNTAFIFGHFCDLFIQAHGYNKLFDKPNISDNTLFYNLFNGGKCSSGISDDIEDKIFQKKYCGLFRDSINKEIKRLDYMIPEKKYDALYFLHHGNRRLLPQSRAAATYNNLFLPGLYTDYFDVAWRIPGVIKKYRIFQKDFIRTYYHDMTYIPVVKDNLKLEYINHNIFKKEYYDALNLLKRCLLPPWKTMWGSEFSNMVEKDLSLWLQEEIINKPFLKSSGIFQESFLDTLFNNGRLNSHFTLAGNLLTVSRFIQKYL